MQKRSSHPGSRAGSKPPKGGVDAIDTDENFPIMAYDFVQKDEKINALHQHNVMEVGLCHRGSGIFIIEDKCFDFKQGDIVVINSSEFHLAQSHRNTTSDWTFIHFHTEHFLGDVPLQAIEDLSGPDFHNRFHSGDYPRLRHAVDIIIAELKEKQKNWQTLVHASLQQLLVLLSRLPSGDQSTPHNLDMTSIAPAIGLISTKYAEQINNQDLADVCEMSEIHFRRQFKHSTGQTPHQYLNNFRIRMACGLLEQEELSIIEVALECGFPTLSTFNRQFKQQMGKSPRDFRKHRA